MSLEKAKPYIGISGVPKHPRTADQLGDMLNAHSLTSHQWMLGYVASEAGVLDTKTSEPRASLVNLTHVLSRNADSSLNAIHYSTRNLQTLASQVHDLLTKTDIYENNLCQAVQFNMGWPQPESLMEIKQDFPNTSLILQINPDTTTSPEALDRLMTYENSVNYVLLDASKGKGKSMDLPQASLLASDISESYSGLTVVFAGGITPDNLAKVVTDISEEYGHTRFGIDAQDGLKTKHPQQGYVFDMRKVKKFVKNAATVFRESRR
jgi:phosphoribosylanthranilate isomerase